MSFKSLKIRNDKRGTALLVAMLVMGVLVAISLALSSLIFREIGVTKDMIDAGKAYYAAESGVELALYKLNTELPGWHTDETEGEIANVSNYSYYVKNTCDSYPCFDSEEYDLSTADASALYDVLDLNETITIPMFTVDEDEDEEVTVKSVKEFTVEFYAGFDPNEDLIFEGDISGWDVLRWKLFGMKEVGGEYITESINDFTAISSNSIVSEPSWFGTMACRESDSGGQIKCNTYSWNDWYESKTGEVCQNTEARDYYEYNESREELVMIRPCYSIGDFLDKHQADEGGATGLNYLSLTNMMNPAMLKDSVGNAQDKQEKSKIYFRVETHGDDVVREYAEIVSDGYSGDTKQSIRVFKKRDSFMPVFNFSIYSTYKDESKDEWYVENAIK